jgi:hypothetical protein
MLWGTRAGGGPRATGHTRAPTPRGRRRGRAAHPALLRYCAFCTLVFGSDSDFRLQTRQVRERRNFSPPRRRASWSAVASPCQGPHANARDKVDAHRRSESRSERSAFRRRHRVRSNVPFVPHPRSSDVSTVSEPGSSSRTTTRAEGMDGDAATEGEAPRAVGDARDADAKVRRVRSRVSSSAADRAARRGNARAGGYYRVEANLLPNLHSSRFASPAARSPPDHSQTPRRFPRRPTRRRRRSTPRRSVTDVAVVFCLPRRSTSSSNKARALPKKTRAKTTRAPGRATKPPRRRRRRPRRRLEMLSRTQGKRTLRRFPRRVPAEGATSLVARRRGRDPPPPRRRPRRVEPRRAPAASPPRAPNFFAPT